MLPHQILVLRWDSAPKGSRFEYCSFCRRFPEQTKDPEESTFLSNYLLSHDYEVAEMLAVKNFWTLGSEPRGAAGENVSNAGKNLSNTQHSIHSHKRFPVRSSFGYRHFIVQ